MTEHNQNDILVKLSDAHLVLSNTAQDVRNRKVIDRHGEEIGHVSDLFVDKLENKLRMLQVGAGGFLGLGDRHFLVPVDAITSVSKDEVHIDQTREKVVNSPVYDPALNEAPSPDILAGYYFYYGYSPYWSPAYTYPRYQSY
jgi:sporulation protein YlmC with PRC-barrel domain